jgi:ubiquinone/menaquinone biosynthesis C-methylase UbiE
MPRDYDESLTIGENVYIVDTTDSRINTADFARLISQDNVLNTEMEGRLLPAGFTPQDDSVVLDVACGPGGWIREVHLLYPQLRLIGIDNNKKAIQTARTDERITHAVNVSFELMDIMQPLAFPDNTFDVVNARLLIGVLPQKHWQPFLSECKRILKPGGYIRLTECEMSWIVGSPMCHRIVTMFLELLWKIGRSFTPTQMAIAPMLPSLLLDTAFIDPQIQMTAVDWSARSRWHDAIAMDMILSVQLMRSAFLQQMSGEELSKLLTDVDEELAREDFKAIWPIVSVQAQKSK